MKTGKQIIADLKKRQGLIQNLNQSRQYVNQASGILATVRAAVDLNGVEVVKNGRELALGALEEAQKYLEQAIKSLK